MFLEFFLLRNFGCGKKGDKDPRKTGDLLQNSLNTSYIANISE